MRILRFPLLLFVFFFPAAAQNCCDDNCVYTVYVKTGSLIKAGTDSNISLALKDTDGCSLQVPYLRKWGLMGYNHDYFERGNLDIFSGRGPCMSRPICGLNLTSDGSGSHHGWYCDYVEVTLTGPHKECSQSIFYVDRWLIKDNLTAVFDNCHDDYYRRYGRFAKRAMDEKRVFMSYPIRSVVA